ncbi:MAG: molybdopterin cofactor-binding domain-containing protein [Pseudomonadales bacterium]|jgi:isoquinoline 1-oxidoreductase beta subunit|nr:molybdopterin cofactor-binding domain-containing protein [Pseudomonadales bacterium]
MTNSATITRRQFIVGASAAGIGLSLGVLPRGASAAAGPDEVNAWVRIATDDTVTIRIARSEMGQGTLTGLAQLVAEELECDWNRVTWEFPTPGQNLARERVWKDFSTGGSNGLRGSQQYVREGGAAARIMLIGAAAEAWGVSASECSARDSVITHGPSGRTTTFGKVAVAAARQPVPQNVTLKDPSTWHTAGKPKMRLDTQDKLTGKLVYGADLRFDGMLLASIMDCPVKGGKLVSFDADAIKDMPGVKKVLAVKTSVGTGLGTDGVAVVADTWWRAHSALKALPIEWDFGPNANFSDADVTRLLESGLDADEAFRGNWAGDMDAAFASAEQMVESVYKCPSQSHAPMEPMNATALVTADKCEVWCPTQNGESALAAAAEASGLPIEKCDVHKTLLGGGFGRRGAPDYVHQVVAIAKAFPGTPIKLQWSREEDQKHGFYHPTTMAKLRGSLDADGKLTGLHMRISGQSILAALIPQALVNGADLATFQGVVKPGLSPSMDQHQISYDFPNLLVDHAMRNPPIRPGFWRGVNVNQNAIYLESFMDELAHAAGRDPLEFRLAHMEKNPKGAAVLKAVAERSGWGSEDGKARGLATMYAFGSYVAACAEVRVVDGKLKIDRIVAATDCGTAVNPQQIQAQVEGSFVYGLSAMLYGEITYKDGQVQQDNFHTYPSMRIAEMPLVEAIVMPSGGFFGGVGEPTIAVAAPAVLNALFAATGKRIRSIPLKDADLTA